MRKEFYSKGEDSEMMMTVNKHNHNTVKIEQLN